MADTNQLLWYEARSAAAAKSFTQKLEVAMDNILDSPESWPFVDEPYRRYLMHSTRTVDGRSCWSTKASSAFLVSRARSCPCAIVDANAIASRGTLTSPVSHPHRSCPEAGGRTGRVRS